MRKRRAAAREGKVAKRTARADGASSASANATGSAAAAASSTVNTTTNVVDDDSNGICWCAESGILALTITPMELLPFVGSVELRIVTGSVVVLGFVLQAGSDSPGSSEEWHTLHSPVGGIPLALQTPTAVSKDARVLLRAVRPRDRPAPLPGTEPASAAGSGAREAHARDEVDADAADEAGGGLHLLWPSLRESENEWVAEENEGDESSDADDEDDPPLEPSTGDGEAGGRGAADRARGVFDPVRGPGPAGRDREADEPGIEGRDGGLNRGDPPDHHHHQHQRQDHRRHDRDEELAVS